MREILFRGIWVHGNKEWIEGDLVRDKDGKPHIVDNNYVDYWHDDQTFVCVEECEVLPETVGQYTGLTDKNGKKIFEGDIVRCDDYIFSIKYGKCGGTPNADNYGYMGFYLEAVSEGTKLCAYYGLRDDICYFTDIEVIGNIHDNKELLEVK